MKRSYEKFVARLKAVALYADVESWARAAHVTLREIYDGPDGAPSIAAARRVVYAQLAERGKGVREIARLFDRAPSGVSESRKTANGKKKRR